MIIHLIRHGEAIERSQEIIEEHRFLTCRGRKRFRKVASSLKKTGVKPDLILTSPLVRAVQTAEILAQALKQRGDLLVSTLLAPGFQPGELDELLSRYPKAREIALVGHEPDLGALAGNLMAAPAGCALQKSAAISFKLATGHQGEAEFLQLIGPDGKIITSRKKALKRLLRG